MGVGKRKKLCGRLWVCLKFSLRILKHRNDDGDDEDNNNKNKTTKNKNKNNNNSSSNILWQHSVAHSDFLSEGLKINKNTSHNDDVSVLYKQVP